VELVFASFQPDLVMLDLHMPEPDGLEVLRRLRSARLSLGFLPVVMLTGDTGHVARNSALILGADEFLIKPLDREEVILRVRNLLRTRQLYVDATEGRKRD
jgi:putative two-component system response regulator